MYLFLKQKLFVCKQGWLCYWKQAEDDKKITKNTIFFSGSPPTDDKRQRTFECSRMWYYVGAVSTCCILLDRKSTWRRRSVGEQCRIHQQLSTPRRQQCQWIPEDAGHQSHRPYHCYEKSIEDDEGPG